MEKLQLTFGFYCAKPRHCTTWSRLRGDRRNALNYWWYRLMFLTVFKKTMYVYSRSFNAIGFVGGIVWQAVFNSSCQRFLSLIDISNILCVLLHCVYTRSVIKRPNVKNCKHCRKGLKAWTSNSLYSFWLRLAKLIVKHLFIMCSRKPKQFFPKALSCAVHVQVPRRLQESTF